jgi:phytoene desaturase
MPRDMPMGAAPVCVVSGAGSGGLAAAARARARGFQVKIVDRQQTPGDRARVLRARKFAWDAGPTVITTPGLLQDLFALLGEKMADHIEMLPVQPWYRIRFADGRHFDHGGSVEEARVSISAFAPDDPAGYDRLTAHTRRLFETGFDRYGAASFHDLRTMLKALPAFLLLGGHRSVRGLVRSYIQNDALAHALSLQPLLVGGHPYRTFALYTLILHLERLWGVWLPHGGTGALVEALVGLLRRHGVEWMPCRAVERILMRAGCAARRWQEAGTVPVSPSRQPCYNRFVSASTIARRCLAFTWWVRAPTPAPACPAC